MTKEEWKRMLKYAKEIEYHAKSLDCKFPIAAKKRIILDEVNKMKELIQCQLMMK